MRDLVLVLAMSVSSACMTAAMTGGAQGEAPSACDIAEGCDYMGGNDESVLLPLAVLAAVVATPLLIQQLWRINRRTPPPRALSWEPT